MKAQNSIPLRRGFALIATISVLLLLTLIAVAFLSLSAVTVKTSQIEWAEEEARANARLALMIAIGELQREMGPDQRVSANAAIMDSSPEQSRVSGVDNPYWLGVWATDWSKSSQGTAQGSTDVKDRIAWERDDDKGGLKDRRSVEGWDRENAVSTYLVSGNEGGKRRRVENGKTFLDALTEGVDGDDASTLVNLGSVNDPLDVVKVKKMELKRERRRPNGMLQNTQIGSYSYWISAENAKASLDLVDRHNQNVPNPQNESGYERLFHAQDIAEETISGFVEFPEDQSENIISVNTARLVNGMDEDSLKQAYHHVTANTRTVLANVRDGGLKKDLNVWLVENGDINPLANNQIEYTGLSGSDLLVGPPNASHQAFMEVSGDNRLVEISPRFSILKNWMEDAKSNNFSVSGGNLDLTGGQRALLPQEFDYGQTGQWTVYDRLLGLNNNMGAKFTELERVSIAPVVVEASLMYNLATRRVTRDGKPTWEDLICLYPRVALWNPYSVEMKVPPMICQLFVNGNKECLVTYEGFATERLYLGFGAGSRGGNGNTFWLLADKGNSPQGVTIPPGETFVYTIDLNRSKRQGNLRGDYSKTNYTNNLLTPFAEPSADRYLMSERVVFAGGDSIFGVNKNQSTLIRQSNEFNRAGDDVNRSKPLTYREDPGGGNRAGGDNYQFMLKDATGQTRVNNGWDHQSQTTDPARGNLRELPLIAVGNISLQAGGSDETPLRWATGITHPVYQVTRRGGPLIKQGDDGTPNVRTRDGFRLRWWDEHLSNLLGGGQLDQSDTERLFQTSSIGNWNIRASYTVRTPFDNLTSRAPYFFGNYTRDLFDQRVSWQSMLPRKSGGNQTGFPFGEPNSSYNEGPVVLFEVPSQNVGIPNIAYLRNLKLSELAWHPTFAIGNSIADPRSEMDGSAPSIDNLPNQSKGGWNVSTMGTASGRDSGRGPDYWAALHRELMMEKPETTSLAFDMSYETNFNLWDTYFIGTNATTKQQRQNQMARFLDDPEGDPLSNSRYGVFDRNDLSTIATDDLSDFYRVASRLALKGGFDVHSTSIEAWKAVLSSTKDVSLNGSSGVIFPSLLNPSGDSYPGDGITADAYSGNRELSEGEIEALAQEIVVQVKKRAPFFGMADFVNRRLTEDPELARAGAIESALNESGVNNSFEQGIIGIEDRTEDLPNISFDAMSDTTRLDHRLKPASQAWGLPGYVTQGDVLGVIGSTLTARSDTFKVRAYGESVDINGKVLARAWCEATVQRTPEPIQSDDIAPGLNPLRGNTTEIDFGRRFKMVGFRWLSRGEV